MKHYVYRITNTQLNKHYYGTRTSIDTPSDDIGIYYFSSSSDNDFLYDQKINPSNYKYKVVYIFSTRKKALELEIKLHSKFDVAINENFYNKAKQTSSGFDTTGTKRKHSQETKNKISEGHKGKTFSKETKLKMSNAAKGKISVKDDKGNISRINKNELLECHVGITKGSKHSQETKNKISEGNKGKHIGSKNTSAKIINIFDNNNNLLFSCNGNFKTICAENNLPYTALKKSYQTNIKLYETSSGYSLTRLKNNGNITFKGWYAISSLKHQGKK